MGEKEWVVTYSLRSPLVVMVTTCQGRNLLLAKRVPLTAMSRWDPPQGEFTSPEHSNELRVERRTAARNQKKKDTLCVSFFFWSR